MPQNEHCTHPFIMSSPCMVCFNEKASSHSFTKCCVNTVCKTCLRYWFETCQQNGKPIPDCLICRKSISLVEARLVLGHPYTQPSKMPPVRLVENDELTRDFLLTYAMEGGRCSAWIIKNGGCNNMTCLCSHRFHWSSPRRHAREAGLNRSLRENQPQVTERRPVAMIPPTFTTVLSTVIWRKFLRGARFLAWCNLNFYGRSSLRAFLKLYGRSPGLLCTYSK